MKRALQIAKFGKGAVSPNPLVGCVIVKNDRIIGEGWHKVYGGPHAEVNAITSVSDKKLLQGADAYVSLEPCSHHGKTPPCADLFVTSKLARVFIANIDPNPLVSAKGVSKLTNAGIKVEAGLCEEEASKINKRFFCFMNKKRPYVILKYAQTSDGFIARKNFDSKWISNASSRKLVHKWRSEEDAILVGKNTALHDDPSLNVRNWHGKNPLRVLIDHHMKLDSQTLNLFDGKIPTVCYNLKEDSSQHNLEWVKLPSQNFIQHLLSDLYSKKVQSIIIEGGASTLNEFIKHELWDEARIFTSDQLFGEGIDAPKLNGRLESQLNIDGNRLETIVNYQGAISTQQAPSDHL